MSVDYTKMKLPKNKKKVKTKYKDREKIKRLMWIVWHYYNYVVITNHDVKLPEMGGELDRAYSFDNLDLDHIENVGSHPESEFDIFNVQLIGREKHRAKTDSGKYNDYRSLDFIRFLKTIF